MSMIQVTLVCLCLKFSAWILFAAEEINPQMSIVIRLCNHWDVYGL